MSIRAWYFVTLLLTALLMGTSFAHTLEMPGKLTVDGLTWLTFQHTLYHYFAYVGAPVELGSIASLAWLTILTRNHRRTFYLALVAAVCFASAFFHRRTIISAHRRAESPKGFCLSSV